MNCLLQAVVRMISQTEKGFWNLNAKDISLSYHDVVPRVWGSLPAGLYPDLGLGEILVEQSEEWRQTKSLSHRGKLSTKKSSVVQN